MKSDSHSLLSEPTIIVGGGFVGLFIAPALIFAALDYTNVTNVVLWSRLEPPLSLAIGWLFFRISVRRWTVLCSLVGFVGILVTALLSYQHGFQVDRGSIFAAIAAIALAIASNLTKDNLNHLSLGVFSWIRNALGTIIFFVIAQLLYGSHHFQDAFSPFLWQWMVVYSAIIVVAGQLCWFRGLRVASSSEVTLAHLLEPIAAIAFAFLILGETPTAAQWVGGSIMGASLVMSAIDALRHRSSSLGKLMVEMLVMPSFRGL